MTIPSLALILNTNPLDPCEKGGQIFTHLIQYGGSLNHKKPS